MTSSLQAELITFMRDRVLPAEPVYESFRREAGPDSHVVPPIVEDLKVEARERGLWNLFLPAESGLTQAEYAPLAELTGWSHDIAPEALNCQAPDSGNMELLHLIGTDHQQEKWLRPLLDGTTRSAFAMTEPNTASSDATNIATRMTIDGDDLIINGHKWWTSGAADPRCSFLVTMGKTDPDAAAHRQQTMVIVPMDAPGLEVIRSVPVFGRQDQHGHCEIRFTDVRVPLDNILGELGGGFAAAQARLGPGRIHHCMRALGAAERALAMLVERAKNRSAFGARLADFGMVHAQIAESRVEIDQARQLCLHAARTIDEHGNKAARNLISAAKIAVPRAALNVIDRAIQVHGGGGVGDDYPLAAMWGWHRSMRLFDGPDEVHLTSLAKAELRADPVLPPYGITGESLT